MSLPTDDRTALTLTMIGEARGEGIIGMRCVGHVVLNRRMHPDWRGKTILEICLKHWQFSCWNENDRNREYLISMGDTDPMFIEAESLAEALLAGDLIDLTDGCNAYYAKGSETPPWAVGKTPHFIQGHHLFFKDIA